MNPGQPKRASEAAAAPTLLTVDPRTDAEWLTLVDARGTSIFQSPDWFRVIGQTYDFDVEAQIVLGNSGPVAGIPYAMVEGLSGLRLVTFPFSDYVDPIAATQEDWKALVATLLERKRPITIRCLHNETPLADDRFEVVKRARWHGIDLRDDLDDQWERLAPSARRAIRKSRQASVEISDAQTTKELRVFYDLHLRLRKRKYRLLAQPYSFFVNLWREFIEKGKGMLMLARVGGEVVAGVLFLEFDDTLYYKFNASTPEFADTRPNDAILWAGIEYGHKRGHRSLDLGLSDWDQDGLIRYKRKYATEESVISFLEHIPEGDRASPDPSTLGQLMPMVTQLLTDERVPDELTEQAASSLYRYFA